MLGTHLAKHRLLLILSEKIGGMKWREEGAIN
jgi:hypothetical protein